MKALLDTIDPIRKLLYIIENIRLVRLLDLTAEKVMPISKLQEKSKTGFQSCLYTVTPILVFA